jgi:hypothetical protein
LAHSEATSTATAAAAAAAAGEGAQQHRHSSSAATATPAAALGPAAARPLRRQQPPRNLLHHPVVAAAASREQQHQQQQQQQHPPPARTATATKGWKTGAIVACAAAVALAGAGLGVHRQLRGQLQRELHEALEMHRQLESELLALQSEADRRTEQRRHQLKLEESLQQLNAELDGTERAIQGEREKLAQRNDELGRLVRAEQAAAAKEGSGVAYAPLDGVVAGGGGAAASSAGMMMTTATTGTNLPQASLTGSVDDNAVDREDLLMGRLVHNLGVEQYGLRPLHVELHLEYHRRNSSTKRTSIHRRYLTAQLSLLQHPITAFVFLQQVEHDLYDGVRMKVVRDAPEGQAGASGAALRTELSDRQRRQRSAMGLASVPVRETGSYVSPLLAADEASGSTDSSPTTTAVDSSQLPRHYHLGLSDDGDLVISTALDRRGVFATIVHGGHVLDKLLLLHEDDARKDLNRHHHREHDSNNKEMHVELISIRLLSSVDDEEHGHSGEDDNDDGDNDEEDEDAEEQYDRHDEH